jgi:hypothetical protein
MLAKISHILIHFVGLKLISMNFVIYPFTPVIAYQQFCAEFFSAKLSPKSTFYAQSVRLNRSLLSDSIYLFAIFIPQMTKYTSLFIIAILLISDATHLTFEKVEFLSILKYTSN